MHRMLPKMQKADAAQKKAVGCPRRPEHQYKAAIKAGSAKEAKEAKSGNKTPKK